WLLHMGLDNLSLARSHLARLTGGDATARELAARYFKEAVDRLRAAGTLHHLWRGLIHRAAFYRVTDNLTGAEQDLDEALRITTRGGMRLYEADVHLELARLRVAQKRGEEARREWAQAKKMIEEMGYGRRTEEVKELDGVIEKMKGGKKIEVNQ